MGLKMKAIVMNAIALAISVTAFPLVFTGVATITGYTHKATFTGMESIALLIPLVALVFMVFNSGWMTVQTIRGKNSGSVNLTQAVAAPLILFLGLLLLGSVILPGLYTLYTTDNGTYTGFQEIIAIVPLPMIVALAFGSGYTAYKSTRSGGKRHSGHRYH